MRRNKAFLPESSTNVLKKMFTPLASVKVNPEKISLPADRSSETEIIKLYKGGGLNV